MYVRCAEDRCTRTCSAVSGYARSSTGERYVCLVGAYAARGLLARKPWCGAGFNAWLPPIANPQSATQGVEGSALWIQVEGEGDDASEGEGDIDPQAIEERQRQLLRDVAKHLRDEHWYCYWCGAAFGDSDALNANCPGDTRDAHDQ